MRRDEKPGGRGFLPAAAEIYALSCHDVIYVRDITVTDDYCAKSAPVTSLAGAGGEEASSGG